MSAAQLVGGVAAQATVASDSDDVRVVKRHHPWRWVFAGVVVLCVVTVVSAFAGAPTISWSTVGHYLTDPSILDGVKLTIFLTVVAQAMGLIGGVLLAIMARSENVVMRSVSAAYIWLFRGTPLLIQIIFWFNLALIFPYVGFHIPGTTIGVSVSTNTLISPMVAAIIALGLNEAAYMAEIVRGGLLAIEQGQTDAATAIGMTKGAAMRYVILPQAIRVIVPPTGNELINMLKNTSLVSVIAAQELLTSAQHIYAVNFMTIELLLVASVWYLALSTVCAIGQGYLERRLSVVLRVRSESWITRLTKRVTARSSSAAGGNHNNSIGS